MGPTVDYQALSSNATATVLWDNFFAVMIILQTPSNITVSFKNSSTLTSVVGSRILLHKVIAFSHLSQQE